MRIIISSRSFCRGLVRTTIEKIGLDTKIAELIIIPEQPSTKKALDIIKYVKNTDAKIFFIDNSSKQAALFMDYSNSTFRGGMEEARNKFIENTGDALLLEFNSIIELVEHIQNNSIELTPTQQLHICTFYSLKEKMDFKGTDSTHTESIANMDQYKIEFLYAPCTIKGLLKDAYDPQKINSQEREKVLSDFLELLTGWDNKILLNKFSIIETFIDNQVVCDTLQNIN